MKNATRNLSILTFAIAKWIVQTTETVVLAQQADRRPQIMAHRSQCEKCGLEPSFSQFVAQECFHDLVAAFVRQWPVLL